MPLSNNATNIGLMPWVTVQCGMPHSHQKRADKSEVTLYERKNGKVRLCMMAHPKSGLPFGKMPRLILAHLVVEFRKNLSNKPMHEARTIDLGRSYAEFMRSIGIDGRSGGRNGNLTRFRDQTKRLITCDITSHEAADPNRPWDDGAWKRTAVASEARLWWQTQQPGVQCLFPSYVRISEYFANACAAAVPVDMDTLAALKSSFAIDLYVWLSYRAGKLHENGDPPAEIPWPLLMEQFGHGYKRERDFRRYFRQYLEQVIQHYPVSVDHKSWPLGIVVYPHPPHVKRRRN